MTGSELQHIYQANGLTDYQLKTADDLLFTHGVNAKKLLGYSQLDDANAKLYVAFIVNFFNTQGMDSRATLVPTGIYYVEDIDLLAKEEPTDEHYTIVGGIVKVIDKDGNQTLHQEWRGMGYEDLEAVEGKPKRYLRFEYEHYGRPEWLHVMDERQWY
jgi:hypothetical protein